MKIKRVVFFVFTLFIALIAADAARAIQIYKGPHGETYIGDYLPDDYASKGYLPKADWEKRRKSIDIVAPEMGIGRPQEKPGDVIASESAEMFLSPDKTAIELALPAAKWAVDIKNISYELRKYAVDKKEDHTYLSAKNTATQFGYAIYIDKIKGMNQRATSADCRNLYMTSAKNTVFNKPDLVKEEIAGLPVAEYTHIDELDGVKFSRRMVHAYIAKHPYCIEIVLSKSDYVPEDRKTFEDLLGAVSINSNYMPPKIAPVATMPAEKSAQTVEPVVSTTRQGASAPETPAVSNPTAPSSAPATSPVAPQAQPAPAPPAAPAP